MITNPLERAKTGLNMWHFQSLSDITDLTYDLPVYELQRSQPLLPSIQEELIQWLDERMSLPDDPDTSWDLKMANVLSVLAVNQHTEALALCMEIIHWISEPQSYLHHKCLRLIEQAIDPVLFAPLARKWLKAMNVHDGTYRSVLILSAKLADGDDETHERILHYLAVDRRMAMYLMKISQDKSFIEFLETQLQLLAPFVKYLPPTEQGVRLGEHEEWADVAEAWHAIAQRHGLIPSHLDTRHLLPLTHPEQTSAETYLLNYREWQEQLDMHLLERFAGPLPWSSHEWIKQIETDLPEWKERFIAAEEVYQDMTAPKRKGLRLIKNDSPTL